MTPIEIIEKVRASIGSNGWDRGVLRDEHGPRCLMGHLFEAVPSEEQTPGSSYAQVIDAILLFTVLSESQLHDVEENIARIRREDNLESVDELKVKACYIGKFNDRRDIDIDDILVVLDKAQKQLESHV